jgi:hypothetical protein
MGVRLKGIFRTWSGVDGFTISWIHDSMVLRDTISSLLQTYVREPATDD